MVIGPLFLEKCLKKKASSFWTFKNHACIWVQIFFKVASRLTIWGGGLNSRYVGIFIQAEPAIWHIKFSDTENFHMKYQYIIL